MYKISAGFSKCSDCYRDVHITHRVGLDLGKFILKTLVRYSFIPGFTPGDYTLCVRIRYTCFSGSNKFLAFHQNLFFFGCVGRCADRNKSFYDPWRWPSSPSDKIVRIPVVWFDNNVSVIGAVTDTVGDWIPSNGIGFR